MKKLISKSTQFSPVEKRQAAVRIAAWTAAREEYARKALEKAYRSAEQEKRENLSNVKDAAVRDAVEAGLRFR